MCCSIRMASNPNHRFLISGISGLLGNRGTKRPREEEPAKLLEEHERQLSAREDLLSNEACKKNARKREKEKARRDAKKAAAAKKGAANLVTHKREIECNIMFANEFPAETEGSSRLDELRKNSVQLGCLSDRTHPKDDERPLKRRKICNRWRRKVLATLDRFRNLSSSIKEMLEKPMKTRMSENAFKKAKRALASIYNRLADLFWEGKTTPDDVRFPTTAFAMLANFKRDRHTKRKELADDWGHKSAEIIDGVKRMYDLEFQIDFNVDTSDEKLK